ncbi:MAG: hypothetical protein HY272_09125 [Gammaproteobacteria bacterium]|nr:hypothetical protein [Gammaproteobacteria bacterium]
MIGIATYGLIRQRSGKEAEPPRPLLLTLTIAWVVQGASGTTFGITSLYFNGELPDIHGVAITALIIKMACVSIGVTLAFFCLRRSASTVQQVPRMTWPISLTLGATALSAAAFLRWFS